MNICILKHISSRLAVDLPVTNSILKHTCLLPTFCYLTITCMVNGLVISLTNHLCFIFRGRNAFCFVDEKVDSPVRFLGSRIQPSWDGLWRGIRIGTGIILATVYLFMWSTVTSIKGLKFEHVCMTRQFLERKYTTNCYYENIVWLWGSENRYNRMYKFALYPISKPRCWSYFLLMADFVL